MAVGLHHADWPGLFWNWPDPDKGPKPVVINTLQAAIYIRPGVLCVIQNTCMPRTWPLMGRMMAVSLEG